MKNARGFTLIELLTVVAIIGILSTALLASLTDARLKAADSAVKQQAVQLRNLLEQERTNSGTYTAIKNGGGGTGPGNFLKANEACGTFTGQFATQAAAACAKLVTAASTGGTCGTGCVYFKTVTLAGQPPGQQDSPTYYSITAYLPYESKKAAVAGLSPSIRYICLGSSGNQSIADGATWNEYGCQNAP